MGHRWICGMLHGREGLNLHVSPVVKSLLFRVRMAYKFHIELPSGLLLKMAIEIVDLPIKNSDFP